MLRRCKRIALAVLGGLAAFGATGCNDYVNERVPIPGTGMGLPTALVDFIVFFMAVVGPVATLIVLYKLFFWRRRYRIAGADSNIELFVSRRKFPVLANALIVPVAPDLKMVFGVAKMARDWGADAAQYEANKVAPLPPGEAFIGTGARYRFKHTVLAVIFDNQKRTSPQLMTQGLRRALQLARDNGANSVIIPDMTENLLTQPNWITPEQRRQTAELTARLMLDAILASRGTVKSIRIWVSDPANADVFEAELRRRESDEGVHLAHACTIRDAMVSIVGAEYLDQIHADAILNPTTNTFAATYAEAPTLVGAGIAESAVSGGHETVEARSVGGYGFTQATRTHGPIPVGDAVLDENAESPYADAVISVAVAGENSLASAETVRQGVLSALALADHHGFRTLIIPHLGAGLADYPAAATAPQVVDAIRDHLYNINRQSPLERVFIVTTDREEDNGYARAIGRYLPWPITIPDAPEHE